MISQATALKSWEPKKIRERHRIVAVLCASGLTNNQIAEVTHYTPSRVSIILNHPTIKRLMPMYRERVADSLTDVGMFIKAHALEAAQVVIGQMRGEFKEGVDLRAIPIQQHAAFRILDITGHSKIERKISATLVIDSEDASRILDTTKQLRDPKYRVDYSEKGNGKPD